MPVNYADLPKAGVARPDFMSSYFVSPHQRSSNKNTYKSTKALGQLYRDIPVELTEEDTVRSKKDQRGRLGLDDDLVLTAAVEALLVGITALHWNTGENEACTAEMSSLARAFGEEYWKICRLNTLGAGMSKAGALSEPEAFVGVIAASIGDKREKRETTARLEAQTTEIFGMLKAEMVGKVKEESEDTIGSLELDKMAQDDDQQGGIRVAVVKRAWAAWKLACEKAVIDVDDGRGGQPEWFGIRSFGFIALDLVLGEILPVG